MVRPENVPVVALGLTVQDVENQLNAALFGQIVGTIPEHDRLTNIRVRFPDRFATIAMNWIACRSACRGRHCRAERPTPPSILPAQTPLRRRNSFRSGNWRRLN